MLNLKLLREKKEIFQKDVANHLGVERTTYVKYERGQSEPSLSTLIKLADFFNVSIDYLLGVSDEENPKHNQNVTPEDFKILEVFHSLDERGKKSILYMLKKESEYIKKGRQQKRTDEEKAPAKLIARGGMKMDLMLSESDLDGFVEDKDIDL